MSDTAAILYTVISTGGALRGRAVSPGGKAEVLQGRTFWTPASTSFHRRSRHDLGPTMWYGVRLVDLLLHPPDDPGNHTPNPRGRLSTIGHRPALRAFVRAAKLAGVRFMLIGGTYRDALVRAASTGDIDVVLVDQPTLDPRAMAAAGFRPVPGESHAWRYAWRDRLIRLEVAAVASSTDRRGPFSIAFQHAGEALIEGVRVAVPRIEDYVILKLLAALGDRRRRGRDLVDVQYAIEAMGGRSPELSLPRLRGRLRTVYGVDGDRLKDVIALLRQVPRPRVTR